MLIFGIDVFLMFVFGLLCVILITLLCRRMQVSSSEGRAAVLSSFITACAMVLCYVIMALVLDNVVGVYW